MEIAVILGALPHACQRVGDTPDNSPGLAPLVKFPEVKLSGAYRDSPSESGDKLLPTMKKDTMLGGALWFSLLFFSSSTRLVGS